MGAVNDKLKVPGFLGARWRVAGVSRSFAARSALVSCGSHLERRNDRYAHLVGSGGLFATREALTRNS